MHKAVKNAMLLLTVKTLKVVLPTVDTLSMAPPAGLNHKAFAFSGKLLQVFSVLFCVYHSRMEAEATPLFILVPCLMVLSRLSYFSDTFLDLADTLELDVGTIPGCLQSWKGQFTLLPISTLWSFQASASKVLVNPQEQSCYLQVSSATSTVQCISVLPVCPVDVSTCRAVKSSSSS
ncbi:hypothetical protein Patl1_34063 [Pistacia atlantica]|uniref:Uncharacterized protein n=1 Tax=Pistacia atlantica TaxID=434234 RepID=A0ACC0ZV11_9ROSI|nr:hypothetical protein Patl1_34063 [Pistacia atlantica]